MCTLYNTGLKTGEKENPLQHFGQESIQNRLREINGELDWQEEERLQNITVSVSL
jgi:signal transduction histidine kinase